ncbi:MAG TPA: hypothetical protein VNJ71_09075 [Gemmatimonadales bacterium]|jgi:hypothetical protein|nr:hypothetical protein [Gemmatimonadales bacterium]
MRRDPLLRTGILLAGIPAALWLAFSSYTFACDSPGRDSWLAIATVWSRCSSHRTAPGPPRPLCEMLDAQADPARPDPTPCVATATPIP